MRLALILSLSTCILFSACGPKNEIEFFGSIASNSEQYIVLKQSVDNKLVTLDSVPVAKDGSFTLSGIVTHPDFLTLNGENGAFLFYGAPGSDIHAAFDETIAIATDLTGNAESVKFFEVNQKSQELNTQREALNQRYQSGEIGRQEAVSQFNQINEDWKAYATSFAENNPESPAVLSTLNVFHPIEDIAIFKNTLAALKPTMGQSDFVKRLEEQIGKAEMQAAQYNAQKKMEAERDQMLAVGKEAPEISLPNPNGETLNLSDLRGKYVLVDFWASWCKPCRQENPNVVAAYKKYRNKGFEILSVSLDKSKGAWVNAIKADNMDWKHVSDLKFWNSEAAKTYGVSSIPFTLLLDKDGKIVAKNLRGVALHNKLAALLNA